MVLVLGSSCVVTGCSRHHAEIPEKEATNVIAGQATASNVVDSEEFTGRTDAILNVQIKSRVTGYLLKRNFQDGDEVHKGDVLYEIDPRPYQTAFNAAESRVKQAQAHRTRLEADFHRATNLFQKGTIGRQEFDLASSNYSEALGSLKASTAQLDTASQFLDFTKIRAPMDGQLSRTLIDPGNLILQETTILNDIVVADKLYVNFDINEESMKRVRSLIQQGRVGSENGKEVAVDVGTSVDFDRYEEASKRLRDLKDQGRPATEAEKKLPREFPYKGVVNFTENKLDAATGTLRVRGILDNQRPWILSPGLFVRVRLPIGEPHPALLIREDSIGSEQGRNFVYIIDRDNEVEYRPVELGALYGGLRVIVSGLKPNEWFIDDADSIRRVRPGAKVASKKPSAKEEAGKLPTKTASR